MDSRKSLIWLSFLLVLLAAISHTGNISYAAAEPTIYVDPPILYAEAGEHFNVSVEIVEAVNVYAWQVNMTFNPAVLECINATEGDFLKTQPETVFYVKINNTRGIIFSGCSTKGEYPGVIGHGTLFTIEFAALVQGECALNITHPNTILLEVNPPPVPPGGEPLREIPSTKEDGVLFNLEAPPTAEFTYSPSIPQVNQTLTFDASASYATPPREIVQYEWDFDDGTTDTGVTAEHIYTTPGTYTITLTVTDDATATALIQSMFDTTTMPHIWYGLYSQTEKDVSMLHEHDIAVTSVAASKETVTAGESVSISVTAVNNGDASEDFTVTAYYDNTAIDTKSVAGLSKGASETLTFTWDTSGVPVDDYTIKAEATVEGEGTPADNVLVDGTVTVEAPGEFPMTPVIVAVVVIVVVVAVGAFFYMRRKSTPT